QYLAGAHVLSVGGVAASENFFTTYAPYVYSPGGNVTNVADWVPGVVCQRMVGLPAIFAGDALYQHSVRKFGVIYPTNPDYQAVGKVVVADMDACKATPAVIYQYALNLSTMASDSASAMAQMRAKGVTTVVCLCDTVVPQFLTKAADAQSYYPEWLTLPEADSASQNYSQDQWSHAIGPNTTTVPQSQSEAYKVYQLANPGGTPQSPAYPAAYQVALLFADGIQNAGPDLNPETFERGFFGLPSTPSGQLGPWAFGFDHFTPQAGAPIGWYSATAVSNEDGKPGAWIACSGSDGAYRPWEPRSNYGPAGTQLHCG
ncbi:MAG: type 1 periplasmic-binding domain-containing protein, partial [Acidimicrobiales bacterium]